MAETQKKTKKQEKKPTANTEKKETKTTKTVSSKAKTETAKKETAKKEVKATKTSTKPKAEKATNKETTQKETKTSKPKATVTTAKESKPAKTSVKKKETGAVKPKVTKAEPKLAEAVENKNKTVKKSSANNENTTKKTNSKKIETKNNKNEKIEIKESNIAKERVKKENNKKIEKKPETQNVIEKSKMETISKALKQNNSSNNISKESSIPETNTKKVKKTEKKYFDISLGTIIAIVAILLLIIINIKLGIHAYNIIKGKDEVQSANSDLQLEDDEQEIGHVLNKKNEIVKNIVEKMTFIPNATASIYKSEEFNAETINNDLKLRLGWAKIKDESKLRAQKENGEEIIAVEREIMKESIRSIFGKQMNYNDQSFNNTDVKTFSGYALNPGVINYNSDLYVANPMAEESETNSPFIYQEIQKLLQYDEKIVVHVKSVFVDVKDGKYILYKNYNNSFKEELAEITPEELLKDKTINKYTGEGTITLETNSALDNIREKLDTYTYTYLLDQETNEYYLSEFNKLIGK